MLEKKKSPFPQWFPGTFFWSPHPSRAHVIILPPPFAFPKAVVLASVGFLSNRRVESGLTALSAEDATCMAEDVISIYKYTIASSAAVADGQWAGDMFGCEFRDVTDTHGCADLGKTSCMASTLAYNLHFVVNHVTESGSMSVADWDEKMASLHGQLKKFDHFMDYRMVFYKPDLNKMVGDLIAAKTPFMLRKGSEADTEWFSLLVMSPSGKMFEVVSSRLSKESISSTPAGSHWLKSEGGDIKTWESETTSCPHTQAATATEGYTVAELDAFFDSFSDAADVLMPIRNQVCVRHMQSLHLISL